MLASASTVEADVRKELAGDSKATGKGGNVAAATVVGKRIAEKAKAAGIEKVAFDRAGFALPRPRQGAGRSGSRSRPAVLIGRSGTNRNRRWQSFNPAPRPKATTTA